MPKYLQEMKGTDEFKETPNHYFDYAILEVHYRAHGSVLQIFFDWEILVKKTGKFRQDCDMMMRWIISSL